MRCARVKVVSVITGWGPGRPLGDSRTRMSAVSPAQQP